MAKNSAKEQGAMSAASVFKAIDNVLKKPGCGCSGSLDYMEQSSWLLFLRYLDAREEERKLEARLNGKVYEPALPRRLRWNEWAYPLDAEGKTSAFWTVDPAKIDRETCDLSVVNPNIEEEELPTAAECKAKIKSIYAEIGEIIKGM